MITNEIIFDILSRHNQNGGSTTLLPAGEDLSGLDLYAVSFCKTLEWKSNIAPSPQDIAQYLTRLPAYSSGSSKAIYALGTWQDGGFHYLDMVVCLPNREDAINLGRGADQIAICYLKDCSIILI